MLRLNLLLRPHLQLARVSPLLPCRGLSTTTPPQHTDDEGHPPAAREGGGQEKSGPLLLYGKMVSAGRLKYDPNQRLALEKLQELHDKIHEEDEEQEAEKKNGKGNGGEDLLGVLFLSSLGSSGFQLLEERDAECAVEEDWLAWSCEIGEDREDLAIQSG